MADDFNNDGKADLRLENSATGERAIWYLSDGIFQSSSALPTLHPQWHIAGSTDFLGILVNGGYSHTTVLPTVPPQWNIVEH